MKRELHRNPKNPLSFYLEYSKSCFLKYFSFENLFK